MPGTPPVRRWFVAAVVPWLTEVRSAASASIAASTLRMPVRNPSAGSLGGDGVLIATIPPGLPPRAARRLPPPVCSLVIRRGTANPDDRGALQRADPRLARLSDPCHPHS